MILAVLQLGRAIGIKVVEEILNERGQAPDEGGVSRVVRSWQVSAYFQTSSEG
ncbi:MAG: hypothetical protein H6668_03175 [Ardenticatenaceae bacterium]|nr:hypothetical protein [Ardenticatenaceae bacterium]